MDLKAKLVELLNEAEEWADHKCDVLDCETCPADKMKGNCVQQLMVDRLISHGVTVQEWISVKDRLPGKMGQYVCRYVFGENTDYPFYQVLWYFANLEKPHFQHEGSMGLTVTHWMPMPQPPKGEDTP